MEELVRLREEEEDNLRLILLQVIISYRVIKTGIFDEIRQNYPDAKNKNSFQFTSLHALFFFLCPRNFRRKYCNRNNVIGGNQNGGQITTRH